MAGTGEKKVESNITNVEVPERKAGPESASAAEGEDAGQLVLQPPPDVPQLLRAAELNSTGTVEEACVEWGRLLALALDDAASDDEQLVAYLNVTDACARAGEAPRSAHDLRLAHEALVRRVLDDPRSQGILDRRAPRIHGMRSAFLVVDHHAVGTRVALDGQPICSEPCTLAVPVDGESHRITFTGSGGGEASVVWAPSTPNAAPPPLPALPV